MSDSACMVLPRSFLIHSFQPVIKQKTNKKIWQWGASEEGCLLHFSLKSFVSAYLYIYFRESFHSRLAIFTSPWFLTAHRECLPGAAQHNILGGVQGLWGRTAWI